MKQRGHRGTGHPIASSGLNGNKTGWGGWGGRGRERKEREGEGKRERRRDERERQRETERSDAKGIELGNRSRLPSVFSGISKTPNDKNTKPSVHARNGPGNGWHEYKLDPVPAFKETQTSGGIQFFPRKINTEKQKVCAAYFKVRRERSCVKAGGFSVSWFP